MSKKAQQRRRVRQERLRNAPMATLRKCLDQLRDQLEVERYRGARSHLSGADQVVARVFDALASRLGARLEVALLQAEPAFLHSLMQSSSLRDGRPVVVEVALKGRALMELEEDIRRRQHILTVSLPAMDLSESIGAEAMVLAGERRLT